jgi:CheY-like chemotaxis protein
MNKVKKRILFVEDEKELVIMMQVRLEANNYKMIPAYDGEEGLETAKSEKPDLIILDVIMPKMDGLSMCKYLKKDPKTKDIPVIILSASGGKDLSERCLSAGADFLIKKPFDSQDLLDKIAKLLAKSAEL